MALEEDWDKGLPFDVLGLVAGGRNDLKAMRAVSKTWRIGFERSAVKIEVDVGGPRQGSNT